jgi:hypothetical protein
MGGVEDEHLKLSQTKSILCQVYDTCEGPLDCGRPKVPGTGTGNLGTNLWMKFIGSTGAGVYIMDGWTNRWKAVSQ